MTHVSPAISKKPVIVGNAKILSLVFLDDRLDGQAKVLTLQTVPAEERQSKLGDLVSRQSGFSLHAGVACKANQRKKLERLCRYITRPALEARLCNRNREEREVRRAGGGDTTGPG